MLTETNETEDKLRHDLANERAASRLQADVSASLQRKLEQERAEVATLKESNAKLLGALEKARDGLEMYLDVFPEFADACPELASKSNADADALERIEAVIAEAKGGAA